MDPILQIGRIPFLVCAPFFHRFLGHPDAEFRFTDGTPKSLNALLRQGIVHLAPSSSLEFAHRPDLYRIAPGICTSSTLEIRSVKLFSRLPWAQLGGGNVHLTGQSDTSVALARVLSHQRFGIRPHFDEQSPYSPEQHCARVLIGDQALQEDAAGHWEFRYDLATVWQEWQGLPFVFGMWMIHQSALETPLRPLLDRFLSEMARSVDEFRSNRPGALQRWCAQYPSQLPWELVLDYYDAIDYRFTPDRQQSLTIFYECCVREGLLSSAPTLDFLV